MFVELSGKKAEVDQEKQAQQNQQHKIFIRKISIQRSIVFLGSDI